jgi:hypothetical protein
MAKRIRNPYLTEALATGFIVRAAQVEHEWNPDADIKHLDENDAERCRLCLKYAFSIPCDDTLHLIAKYARSVVDYGAGAGYWGYMLKQAGIRYMGIDDFTWADAIPMGAHHRVTRGRIGMLQANHAAVPFDALLLSWPCGDDSMAYNAASACEWRYIFYSGEARGGSTAADDFHDFIAAHYNEVASIPEYNWTGNHSNFYVYERKNGGAL